MQFTYFEFKNKQDLLKNNNSEHIPFNIAMTGE